MIRKLEILGPPPLDELVRYFIAGQQVSFKYRDVETKTISHVRVRLTHIIAPGLDNPGLFLCHGLVQDATHNGRLVLRYDYESKRPFIAHADFISQSIEMAHPAGTSLL